MTIQDDWNAFTKAHNSELAKLDLDDKTPKITHALDSTIEWRWKVIDDVPGVIGVIVDGTRTGWVSHSLVWDRDEKEN